MMRKQAFKRLCIIAFLSLIPILLSACVNLKAIRQFADVSADAPGYAALTADYVNAPESMKRYEPKDRHPTLTKQREEREKQRKALLGLHRGVREYMIALGALASDELVSYDKSLDPLATAIKDAKVSHLGDAQVDAFSALAKLLAKAATDAYRQNQLKTMIGDSNKDFQVLVDAMKMIVGGAYASSLDTEKAALDKYYRDVVEDAKRNPPQQAATELVTEVWYAKQDTIAEKKQSCELYVEMLKTIGEGHQLLYNDRNNLKSKQLLDTIYSYSRDIEALNSTISKLK